MEHDQDGRARLFVRGFSDFTRPSIGREYRANSERLILHGIYRILFLSKRADRRAREACHENRHLTALTPRAFTTNIRRIFWRMSRVI